MNSRQDLIKVAKSYEGANYKHFTGDFGCTDAATVRKDFAWCAAFVVVCAKEANCSEIVPRSTSCNDIISWYSKRGRFTRDKSRVEIGWFPTYDWDVNPNEYRPADHIGIVIDYDDTYIWVIEGNKGNDYNDKTKVGIRKIERDSKYIYGYCMPEFNDDNSEQPVPAHEDKPIKVDLLEIEKGSTGPVVETLQFLLKYKFGLNLGEVPVDGEFGELTEKAVKSVQTDAKIDVDGIVGSDTWKAILS